MKNEIEYQYGKKEWKLSYIMLRLHSLNTWKKHAKSKSERESQ